jgi:type IV pilus assembly protein PilE
VYTDPKFPYRRPESQPQGHRGFTLIELMIVVAIVAILSMVAFPSYLSYITKGKRAEGRAALLALMQHQERNLTQNGTYATFAAGATGTAFKTFSGDSQAQAAYLLGAELCPAVGALPVPSLRECVRVFANPVRTDAEVGTLRMLAAGLVKSCTGTKPEKCWR